MSKPRLCYVSILGAPGSYDPAIYGGENGGDDELVWIADLLDRTGLADRVEFSGVHGALGEPLPEADSADVFMLGGSYHSVHDGLAWQDAVYGWLARLRVAKRPLLGICGGHQMMAMALGGAVGFVQDGPLTASLPVTLTTEHNLFDGFGAEPLFHFANEEHVTIAPQGARVLATRPEMPYCALDYGGGWLSVQFHPEATARCIALAWKGGPHEQSVDYQPLPDAHRLLVNFIFG